MDIKQVDLTPKNPALGRLQSKPLEKAYTVVPDRVLPSSLRVELDALKGALGLEPTSDESVTFVIQGAKSEGRYGFKRLFQPKVYKVTDDNGKQTLVLKWGSELCYLKALKSNIEVPAREGYTGISKDTENAAISVITAGKDEFVDVFMKVTVETPNGYIYAEFPVATADDVKGSALNTAMDLNIGKALDLVRELPEAMEETEVIDLIDLTPGTYQITGYRTFSNEYGANAIVQIAAAPELGQEKPFSCYVRKYVETFLSSPVITEDSPAELVYTSTTPKTGKQKKDQPNYTITLPTQPQNGDYASLDF